MARGGTPLYVGPGSTKVKVIDSYFKGESIGSSIYLDAESAMNVIKNNHFSVTQITKSTNVKVLFWNFGGEYAREVIAVDGSARNIIVNNVFNKADWGGVYLYRNCGEGGTIKHQAPRGNNISNNFFYYENFSGSREYKTGVTWYGSYEKTRVNFPSVYVGARSRLDDVGRRVINFVTTTMSILLVAV